MKFGEWERTKVLAEGVGFEPTRERNPLPVFKTGALNHSAILPSEKTIAYSGALGLRLRFATGLPPQMFSIRARHGNRCA
jgi:hypothetical protein